MNYRFGGFGAVCLDDFRPAPQEAREQVANSRFGAAVADLMQTVTRSGASPAVRDRLKARALAPCDVGTEGCVIEENSLMEEAESVRLNRELGIG